MVAFAVAEGKLFLGQLDATAAAAAAALVAVVAQKIAVAGSEGKPAMTMMTAMS